MPSAKTATFFFTFVSHFFNLYSWCFASPYYIRTSLLPFGFSFSSSFSWYTTHTSLMLLIIHCDYNENNSPKLIFD
jgi:hypothetical protein